VCEEYDSMGVRKIVDSRQSKVERAKIGGAKRLKPLGVNSDEPTGAEQAPDTQARSV
jgi:hypothetical protein